MARQEYPGPDQLAYWQAQFDDPEFIYVIQGDPATPIKVGYARDPLKRLATLQTGSWQELRLLCVLPGDKAAERECHRRLHHASVRGEWFYGETADEFLAAFARHSEFAVSFHQLQGKVIPFTRNSERRIKRYGMRSGGWERKLGGLWRTSDGEQRPLTIKHAEPDPVDPDEQLELQRRAIRAGRSLDQQKRIEQTKARLKTSRP